MSTEFNGKNQETGYAKLNLALHIRGRLPNGYHELETIFAFVDQGDLVSVSDDQALSLTISGPFADGLGLQDNLIMQAASLLQKEYDVSTGAKLHLVKNLPVASGIGGGSADAAAALRLLNRYWELNLSQVELERVAEPLGADVPACVASKTAIGRGIGQNLQPLCNDDLSGMYVLLANPLVAISTQDIFSQWNGIDKGPLGTGNIFDALVDGRNDLQSIAITLEDSIAPLLTVIGNTNAISTKMSGSGATCFGVYESLEQVREAKLAVESSVEKIWTMTGQIR